MSQIPSQKNNFSEWYNKTIRLAELIDDTDVRGCVILKPYGYAIWENIQKILDEKFKSIGIQNAYFPMFIPKSYFSKEAAHVSGFAKECAIVTHYRLKQVDNNIVVDDNAKLDDEYIVRPTSETIIWDSFRKWIHSYRDLPLKINQWCNVCRWEMRTRPFLRTSEFLWQEGHTVHATSEEAYKQVMQMYNIYDSFGRDYLAIPFIRGIKTEQEKFAGADKTFTLEALMKDGKALQCATVHMLGQNFSRAFQVQCLDKNNKLQYPLGTSWGLSTRIIGVVIMTHGDDKGLVLPPKIAPTQVVIIPIIKDEISKKSIMTYAKDIHNKLCANNVRATIDDRDDKSAGFKYNIWEVKGVPIQVRIGINEVNNCSSEIVRRYDGQKQNIPLDNILIFIKQQLETIQEEMYNKALSFRKSHTYIADNDDEFKKLLINKEGFVKYKYTPEIEDKIKNIIGASVRCQEIDESGIVKNFSEAIYAQNY